LNRLRYSGKSLNRVLGAGHDDRSIENITMRWVMVSAVVVAEEKEKESYVLAGCGNVSG
jgi:hypothetical protein